MGTDTLGGQRVFVSRKTTVSGVRPTDRRYRKTREGWKETVRGDRTSHEEGPVGDETRTGHDLESGGPDGDPSLPRSPVSKSGRTEISKVLGPLITCLLTTDVQSGKVEDRTDAGGLRLALRV